MRTIAVDDGITISQLKRFFGDNYRLSRIDTNNYKLKVIKSVDKNCTNCGKVHQNKLCLCVKCEILLNNEQGGMY